MKSGLAGRLVGLLLVFLPVPLCASQGGDAAVFLSRVQQAAEQVRSFSADFVQEKRLVLFEEPVIFHGVLTVVRPDKLRWEFFEPLPSALVLDGDRGLRCVDDAPPRRFTLEEDPIMGVVAEQLWLWLGGDYRGLARNYRVRLEGELSVVVTPAGTDDPEYLESVRIVFDRDALHPRQVIITEPGGNQTLISFGDPVLNPDVPEELFSSCGHD